jgi:hypothetical protein
MRLLTALQRLTAVVAVALTATAAAQSTFRVSQVFSNLDGSIQYVSLTETAGLDNQGMFKGLTLTITHAGVAKQFTFYDNLATFRTAHLTIVVAATPDVVPAPSIPDNTGNYIVQGHPDFVVPARFVPGDGGTIDFAGFDQMSYPALPADGSTAWFRDGTFAPGTLPGNYGCGLVPSSKCPGLIHPTPTFVSAVEYYNATLDRYFMTASGVEIDALDSGRLAGWQRTGESLTVGEAPRTLFFLEYAYGGNPVCRFYLPPPDGDSHFLSAAADECAAVRARFPTFTEETSAAFYAATPDPANHECPVLHSIDFDNALQPVYRLWSGRADGNHRYTTSTAIRAAMIGRGWLPEGYGPLGVVMCV